MSILIKAAKLIDGKGSTVENAALLMDGDRITALGRQADIQPGEGVEVIEAGNRTIMPGLIDAHVHLVNSGGPLSAMDARSASASGEFRGGSSTAAVSGSDQQSMIVCRCWTNHRLHAAA